MPNRELKPQKILVVDDDPFMRETLSRYLCAAGMEVKTAENARIMDDFLRTEQVDLITLDVQMPGEDGLSACRRVRRSGNQTPIIMVTGKCEDTDRIVGLELGADDYLAKPLNLRELQARISAVLRRAPCSTQKVPQMKGPLSFGSFTLNLLSGQLFKSAVQVTLTRGELSLLKVFATHPGQVMGREELAVLAQGRAFEAFDRSLDVQVARLRKIVETNLESPRHIQTVWGKGYVFVPEG